MWNLYIEILLDKLYNIYKKLWGIFVNYLFIYERLVIMKLKKVLAVVSTAVAVIVGTMSGASALNAPAAMMSTMMAL